MPLVNSFYVVLLPTFVGQVSKVHFLLSPLPLCLSLLLLSILFLPEKTEGKCRRRTFISIFIMQQPIEKKSNIDRNEIKTKPVPLPHHTPGKTNTNSFVNRWLLKIPVDFRIHRLAGKTVEREKGKESKYCERRISLFSPVFLQKCSRSAMKAFHVSLVIGRDLLLQGYKNVTAPEGDCCLSLLLGVVIN